MLPIPYPEGLQTFFWHQILYNTPGEQMTRSKAVLRQEEDGHSPAARLLNQDHAADQHESNLRLLELLDKLLRSTNLPALVVFHQVDFLEWSVRYFTTILGRKLLYTHRYHTPLTQQQMMAQWCAQQVALFFIDRALLDKISLGQKGQAPVVHRPDLRIIIDTSALNTPPIDHNYRNRLKALGPLRYPVYTAVLSPQSRIGEGIMRSDLDPALYEPILSYLNRWLHHQFRAEAVIELKAILPSFPPYWAALFQDAVAIAIAEKKLCLKQGTHLVRRS